MAITTADIARARKHMGYPAAQAGVGYAFGYPILTQPSYLFETQIQHIIPANEAQLVRILDVLDGIECRMIDSATTGWPATSAESVEFNREEPNDLEREYTRWANRLADLIGCPLNPWAERFKGGTATGNIQVR